MHVEIHPSIATQVVHPGWCDKALVEIKNSDLRETILNADRFAKRIVADLLKDLNVGALRDQENINEITRQIAARVDDASLTIIGQIWLAPYLAPRLLSPSERSVVRVDDRRTLRFILKYQNHAELDGSRDLTHPFDYAYEGAACVAAWISMTSDPSAKRLNLCLPPEVVANFSHDADRARLIGRLFCDAEFLEG